jgi:hypothetical protein
MRTKSAHLLAGLILQYSACVAVATPGAEGSREELRARVAELEQAVRKGDVATLAQHVDSLVASLEQIRADGLTFKFQVGPCAWTGAGLGLQLTDVKVVYKARPMLSLDGQSACKLAWNNDPNGISISIGDLNIIGVQNNLDKLAKDATREAVNAALDAFFGSALRGELQKVVLNTCGGGVKVKMR